MNRREGIAFFEHARRITFPNRIIPDISIEMIPIIIPDRIGLQEPAQCRRVGACLVVVDADLGDGDLAGILEPSDIGGVRDAIGVKAVDLDRAAIGVGDRGDTALPVGEQVAAGADADRCTIVPDQRIVGAVAVDIAVADGAGGIIFRDQRITVIEELGGGPRAAAIDLEQPAQRIIDQRRSFRPTGADQAVFRIIGEGRAAVGDQVAIGVMGEAGRTRHVILVEAVGGVVAIDVIVAAVGVEIIAGRARLYLTGRSVGEAEGVVVCRAVQIADDRRHAAHRVIDIGVGGLETVQSGIFSPGVVDIGVGDATTVFPDAVRPVQPVIKIQEIFAVRMGDPRAVAVGVILVGERPRCAEHAVCRAENTSGIVVGCVYSGTGARRKARI